MKNLQLVFTLLLVALFSVACVRSSSTEVGHWRGPNGDGKYPDKGLLKEWPENGPAVVWKYEQLGKGYSSPTFTKNGFFITGTTDSIGSVFSFDLAGNLNWKKEYGKEWLLNFAGSRTTPTIVGDHGYLMSSLGEVYCFNTENGDEVWSVDLFEKYGARQVRFGITEILRIDGDRIYCTPGGEEHNVVALNRFTGELIWSSKGVGARNAYCPITIFTHGGVEYLATVTELNVMALKAENGELAWSFVTENKAGIHANSPIYRDGMLFISNGWNEGSFMLKIADDGQGAELLWKNELMDLENGDAILIGDNLYGSNWEHKGLSCVDWNTGEEKFTTKELISGNISYADGLFYWFGINGNVALVKATDSAFEIISSFQLEGKKSRDHSAHTVIHNKKLYVRYDSNLWAFDISE